ncbi:MAG: hypothetical protein DMF14_15775, partial [Verrucomicrobia bacterium]
MLCVLTKLFYRIRKALAHYLLRMGFTCQQTKLVTKSNHTKQQPKKTIPMKFLKYATLIGAVCAAFAMQPAKADTFTSSIDTPNDAISPFTGPYGSVLVDL